MSGEYVLLNLNCLSKRGILLQNFAAAIAGARQLGMQWEEIERQIPRLHLPKMRFEQFEKSGVWFINDAYNANPASMRAALENLPEPKEGGKRIAVLATMKELGLFSVEAHQEIGRLAQKRVDVLLCLGDETAPLCEAYRESMKPAELFFDHHNGCGKTERDHAAGRCGPVERIAQHATGKIAGDDPCCSSLYDFLAAAVVFATFLRCRRHLPIFRPA